MSTASGRPDPSRIGAATSMWMSPEGSPRTRSPSAGSRETTDLRGQATRLGVQVRHGGFDREEQIALGRREDHVEVASLLCRWVPAEEQPRRSTQVRSARARYPGPRSHAATAWPLKAQPGTDVGVRDSRFAPVDDLVGLQVAYHAELGVPLRADRVDRLPVDGGSGHADQHGDRDDHAGPDDARPGGVPLDFTGSLGSGGSPTSRELPFPSRTREDKGRFLGPRHRSRGAGITRPGLAPSPPPRPPRTRPPSACPRGPVADDRWPWLSLVERGALRAHVGPRDTRQDEPRARSDKASLPTRSQHVMTDRHDRRPGR